MKELNKYHSSDIDLVDLLVLLYKSKNILIFSIIISIFAWLFFEYTTSKQISRAEAVIETNENMKFIFSSGTIEYLDTNNFTINDFYNLFMYNFRNYNNFYDKLNKNFSLNQINSIFASITTKEIAKNQLRISIAGEIEKDLLKMSLIDLINNASTLTNLNLLNYIDKEIIGIDNEMKSLRNLQLKKIERKKDILEYQKLVNLNAFKFYKQGLAIELKENIKIAKKMGFEDPVLENLQSDLYIKDIIIAFESEENSSINEISDDSSKENYKNQESQQDVLNLVATLPTNQKNISYLYGWKILEELLLVLEKNGLSSTEQMSISAINAELDSIDYAKGDNFILGFQDLEERYVLLKSVKDELNKVFQDPELRILINWRESSIKSFNEETPRSITLVIALLLGLIIGSFFILFRNAIRIRS